MASPRYLSPILVLKAPVSLCEHLVLFPSSSILLPFRITLTRKESSQWVSRRRTQRFSNILPITTTTHLPMRGKTPLRIQLGLRLLL